MRGRLVLWSGGGVCVCVEVTSGWECDDAKMLTTWWPGASRGGGDLNSNMGTDDILCDSEVWLTSPFRSSRPRRPPSFLRS